MSDPGTAQKVVVWDPESEAERATRSGRIFNPYILDQAIVVPRRRVRDLLIHHADDESDNESDIADDHDEWQHTVHTPGEDPQPIPNCGKRKHKLHSRPSSPVFSKKIHSATDLDLKPNPSSPVLLEDPDAPFQLTSDSDPISSTTSTARRIPTADVIPDTHLLSPSELRLALKKLKHLWVQHSNRKAARATSRATSSIGQKAVNYARVQLTDPLLIPTHFVQHTAPVASTGWMGLRDTAIRNTASHDDTCYIPSRGGPEG
ncbi:hypothetical protein DFH07DRAFT_973265 [Mycena maculata]|uniref:Uncharacterized protein n=1 Tax=Mycena maculata TaxID=230809 RepID=A0AAD7HEA8_9AGAR|nr:hypothetical protein DFH07DRAFT_973265 [Mycena maculata]